MGIRTWLQRQMLGLYTVLITTITTRLMAYASLTTWVSQYQTYTVLLYTEAGVSERAFS